MNARWFHALTWAIAVTAASSLIPTPALSQTAASPSRNGIPDGLIRVPATNIEIGGLRSGILDRSDAVIEGKYIEAFRFRSEAGKPIRVRVVGSMDNRPANRLTLLPTLFLFGPDNQLIARAEVDLGTASSYIVFQSPSTGTYTAFITGAPVNSPGRYSITVREVEPSALAGIQLPMISGVQGTQTGGRSTPQNEAVGSQSSP